MAATNAMTANWREVIMGDEDETEIVNQLSDRPGWAEERFLESLKLYKSLRACEDSYVAPVIQQALDCVEQAFRLYGPDAVISSFNGGKDAVVILHLVRAVQAHFFSTSMGPDPSSLSSTPNSGKGSGQQHKYWGTRPRVIYFQHDGEFPEVLSFLRESVETLDLDMLAFPIGTKYGEGLKVLVDHSRMGENSPQSANDGMHPVDITGRPESRKLPLAFVLGTRSSDPNAGSQGEFAPSTLGKMPPFMRVNPVLSWTYGHVWHFLRLFRLPYCSLYDDGYTSLGTIHDTDRSPALAVSSRQDDDSSSKYFPAYMLRDWDQERAGRRKKTANSTSKPKGKTVVPAQEVTESDSASPKVDAVRSGGRAESGISASDDRTASELYDGDHCTVGLIVIGDEILKGQTADFNTVVAARVLREQGVLLSRVGIVSDHQRDIVEEIERMRETVDVVITSGGVGPTHDDVTIKSVAEALGQELVQHQEMAALLKKKMGSNNSNDGEEGKDDLTEAQKKMATLPEGAQLRYVGKKPSDWPILQCEDIFVLPGVPAIFETKITALSEYLSSELERGLEYKVILRLDEAAIVPTLNDAVDTHPYVSFGSYPFLGHPDMKTVLTLEAKRFRTEGEDEVLAQGSENTAAIEQRSSPQKFTKEEMDENVKAALEGLLSALPVDGVLRVDNNVGSLSM